MKSRLPFRTVGSSQALETTVTCEIARHDEEDLIFLSFNSFGAFFMMFQQYNKYTTFTFFMEIIVFLLENQPSRKSLL